MQYGGAVNKGLPVLQPCKSLTGTCNAVRAGLVTSRLRSQGQMQALPSPQLRPAPALQALRLPSGCPAKAGVPAAQTQSSLSRWSCRLGSQHQQMAAGPGQISTLLSRYAHWEEAHCCWSCAALA